MGIIDYIKFRLLNNWVKQYNIGVAILMMMKGCINR